MLIPIFLFAGKFIFRRHLIQQDIPPNYHVLQWFPLPIINRKFLFFFLCSLLEKSGVAAIIGEWLPGSVVSIARVR